MIKKFLLIYIFLLVPLLKAQSDLDILLYSKLDELPASTKCGMMVYDTILQDTVFSFNASLPLIPASNTKIYTTAAPLSTMSGDFLFSTIISSDSPNNKDGVIEGNIYIKGFGNPYFTYAQLDSMVKFVYDKGVRKITGNIIADGTYFDEYFSREDWITDESSNLRLPPVSALVLNRNTINVTLRAPSKTNSLLKYSFEPDCSFYNVNVKAKSTKRKSAPKILLNSSADGITIDIAGGLKKNTVSSYSVIVDDPIRFTAFILYDLLKKRGVEIMGSPIKGEIISPLFELCKSSVSLGNLIMPINKKSDNFAAECLFKSFGAFISGKQGNSFYSTQAVLSFLRENEIYHAGTSIVDGSGISRYNSTTVKSIVELLNMIYFDPYLYPYFYNSLAVAGQDGTLSRRFANSSAANRFRGKTGYLRGVSSISGYLTSLSGGVYIVSIIIEFSQKDVTFYKRIQEDLISILADYL